VHQYIKEIHEKVLKDYDIVTIGEMSGNLEFYEAMKYIAKERKELSMVFHFAHLKVVCEIPLYRAITRESQYRFRTKGREVNGMFGSGGFGN
jgi:glycosidase